MTMIDEVIISIPTVPEPEYHLRKRWLNYEDTSGDESPLLRVEVYDSKDGYGIVGEDMIPGRSITIRADKEYQARLTYLREGKSPYPIFVYVIPQNKGRTHLAWILDDDREAGGDLSGGKTVDLRDVWATGRWIIEGSRNE